MTPGRRGASARAAKARATEAKARYDAAGNGRRIAAWNAPSTGPRRATENTERLRNRAHDSIRNDWASASTTTKWATSLVGVGITPRWKNKRLRELWLDYVPFADADGVLDAYGQQTLGVRSWIGSGEVFLRRRPRALSLPLPAPVQFQLVESAFCPIFDADVWTGMPTGNVIRQGVEFNKYGRRTAYWMYPEHPGDAQGTPAMGQLIRIPASEIRHVFEPKRPGQVRGVSELATMLTRIRASSDFEDAVLDRQKLANLFVMFVTRQLPELSADDFDPNTGLPKWYNRADRKMAGLEPGISQELDPGEDVKFANPPEAGTTYSDYLRSTHLGTAAGGGLPYELMSGDIRDISDRTLRVVINEFRRFARQRQWQIVIPMLCQPMVDWWADALVLKGDLSIAEASEAKRPKWSPEGWEYIHPTQDAEGKKIELEMGVTSRDRIAGGRGDDIEEIDDEREADLKRSKAKGLEPPPPPAPGAGPAAPAPSKPKPTAESNALDSIHALLVDMHARAPAPTPAPAPAPDAVAMLAPVLGEMLAVMRAQSEQMAAITKAQAERPTEVHAHVAPAAVSVTNEVNPTPVEMHNHVDVSPTPVEMHNHVEVQPAAPAVVSVTNEITELAITSMPTRETTTYVRRDAQDEIVETSTVERDVKKGN